MSSAATAKDTFDPRTLDQSVPRIQKALYSVFSKRRPGSKIIKIEIGHSEYIVTWEYPGSKVGQYNMTDYPFVINESLTAEIEAAIHEKES